jgi:hypothetical protein
VSELSLSYSLVFYTGLLNGDPRLPLEAFSASFLIFLYELSSGLRIGTIFFAGCVYYRYPVPEVDWSSLCFFRDSLSWIFLLVKKSRNLSLNCLTTPPFTWSLYLYRLLISFKWFWICIFLRFGLSVGVIDMSSAKR